MNSAYDFADFINIDNTILESNSLDYDHSNQKALSSDSFKGYGQPSMSKVDDKKAIKNSALKTQVNNNIEQKLTLSSIQNIINKHKTAQEAAIFMTKNVTSQDKITPATSKLIESGYLTGVAICLNRLSNQFKPIISKMKMFRHFKINNFMLYLTIKLPERMHRGYYIF